MTTGNVSQQHPDYVEFRSEWQLMRDAVRGEKAIKERGIEYLPMPEGFGTDSDGGTNRYEGSYKFRAEYDEIVNPAIQAMVGVIHGREIQIAIPDVMEDLWENATADGLPLEAFHRRITAEVLAQGRYGLLVGAPSEGTDLPYLVGYEAETIINWDEDRKFFVLDESGLVRDGFAWKEQEQYRVLELNEAGEYEARVYNEDQVAEEVDPADIRAKGGQRLKEIPFVIIGPRDLSVKPEQPPLMSMARATIAMYQLSADHRWQLFMSGQETLFIINGEKPEFVGAGSVVVLTSEAGEEAEGEYRQPDAKYVGPSCAGIDAHKEAIDDEKQKAISAGARLFNSAGSRQVESGEALQVRYAAETASLLTVAQASCAGLEKALRHVARFMGLSDSVIEEIVVTPPKKLIDRTLTPQEMDSLLKLWTDGAISYETFYDNLQRGNVASSERDAEEEQELIDDEGFDDEVELGAIDPATGLPVPPPDPNAPPVDPNAQRPPRAPAAPPRAPARAA